MTPASARAALLWLCTAYFAMGTAGFTVIGGLPVIAEDLHVPPDAVARLFGVFAITFAVGAPAVQILLGHWRRRSIVLAGLGLTTLGTLASGLAPNYEWLVVARVVTGLGSAAIGPVASALGASLVPPAEQPRALATVFLGMTLSSVISAPVSTWMAVTLGWRPMMFAIVLLLAVVALGVWRWVPRGEPGQALALHDMLTLLRHRGMQSAMAIMVLQMAGIFATFTLIVPLLMQRFGLSHSLVSSALLAFGVAGVAGNFVTRRVSVRWGAEPLQSAALLVLAGVFGAGGLLPPTVMLPFAMLCVWAMANDTFMVSQQRRLIEMLPHARPLALAINASAVYVAMSGGTVVASVVYNLAGLAWIPVASCVLVLSAWGLLRLSRGHSAADARAPG